MPFGGLLTAGILTGVGALGGALSNRKKTSTQSSSFNQTATTTPHESPEQSQLYQALFQQAMQRLGTETPLAGYTGTGLHNINRTSDLVQQSLANRLSAQGLTGSAVAGNAMTQAELARGGQSAEFLNSLPLLQHQLALQNMAAAGGVYGLRPIGQTTTSSGTSTGTATTPSNMLGGAFSGAGGMLGLLAGAGAFPGIPGWGGGGGPNFGLPQQMPFNLNNIASIIGQRPPGS